MPKRRCGGHEALGDSTYTKAGISHHARLKSPRPYEDKSFRNWRSHRNEARDLLNAQRYQRNALLPMVDSKTSSSRDTQSMHQNGTTTVYRHDEELSSLFVILIIVFVVLLCSLPTSTLICFFIGFAFTQGVRICSDSLFEQERPVFHKVDFNTPPSIFWLIWPAPSYSQSSRAQPSKMCRDLKVGMAADPKVLFRFGPAHLLGRI